MGYVAICPTSKFSVGDNIPAICSMTELLHAPCRYASRFSSAKIEVPATSKTWPFGLYLNAIEPLEIFDQVMQGLK